jgi:hypothetical protein
MSEFKQNISLKPNVKILNSSEIISSTPISLPTLQLPSLPPSSLPTPLPPTTVSLSSISTPSPTSSVPFQTPLQTPSVALSTPSPVSVPVSSPTPVPTSSLLLSKSAPSSAPSSRPPLTSLPIPEKKIILKEQQNSISPTNDIDSTSPKKSPLITVYNFMIFICVILVIVLVIIYLLDRKNNLTKVDSTSFSTPLYSDWMEGNTEPSLTLTIPIDLINHKVYLNIKNNIKSVNIILPKAANLLEFDTLQLIVSNTKENVSFTYYLYEDNFDSIFQTNTYFINTQYNLASLKIVKNAERNLIWTCVGAGILENM